MDQGAGADGAASIGTTSGVNVEKNNFSTARNTGEAGPDGQSYKRLSRRPTKEKLLNLPEVPQDTTAAVMLSTHRAAARLGVTWETINRAIASDRLTAYKNSNLGGELPETVILLPDLLAFGTTVKKDKRRDNTETIPTDHSGGAGPS